MGLTSDAGRFVAELSERSIPAAAWPVAESGFCDCVAVMLAARKEKAVTALTAVVEPGSRGGCSVVATRNRLAATDAALINGTAAHAQDFDDIGLGVHPAHPSAVMVPAILALAEETGASGAEMLTAYVAGYEVWGECARREPGQHLELGWHATGILGPLAAAAAAASLLHLDAGQCATALSIAASEASGLVANFGSMTKPLHAGMAARAGVLAARLAAGGFTAGTTTLEQPQGLLDAISPNRQADLGARSAFGEVWNIVDFPLGIKRYPVCYALHRVIDCATELHRGLEGRWDRIVGVEVTIGTLQRKMLKFPRPADVLQAKFSIEFGTAIGLLEGGLGSRHLDAAFLSDPRVTALMEKVEVVEDSALDPVYRTFSPEDAVQVLLDDGTRLAHREAYAKGHPKRPLAPQDLQRKFQDCTQGALTPEQSGTLFDRLIHLRSAKDATFMRTVTEID